MAPAIPMVSICLPPADAYMAVVQKGEKTVAGGALKCFHQAFVGGCYIGFGGLLSMVIGGQIPGADPGTQKFVFAALFPVNLLLILLTGGSLYTGNTAAMPAAVFEGKTNWYQALKYLAVSWVGNFSACIVFAYLTDYAELCAGDYAEKTGCGYLAMEVVQSKVSKDLCPGGVAASCDASVAVVGRGAPLVRISWDTMHEYTLTSGTWVTFVLILLLALVITFCAGLSIGVKKAVRRQIDKLVVPTASSPSRMGTPRGATPHYTPVEAMPPPQQQQLSRRMPTAMRTATPPRLPTAPHEPSPRVPTAPEPEPEPQLPRVWTPEPLPKVPKPPTFNALLAARCFRHGGL